ncbi:MAG: LAGLIDADG family homing endonuclease [Candidatus Sungbacteria bacterium]|nr:LAGLIDADG family homing endonuclease [Candidatus Sungbacteria bacterium]
MLSPDYIVGLTDGEGSFTAYIRPPKKEHGSKNYRIECHYYIKLREDDRSLLENVKNFFRTGRVVFQRENRTNHHHMYRFEVTNLHDLQNLIIPFFEKHKLQSKRIKDFELFKKIVKAVLNKEHQTENGLRKIQQWKKKMHQYMGSPNTGNPYVRSRYRKSRVRLKNRTGNGK